MSHIATQRVIVRMLFDPAFATAVYEDADRALKDENLSPEEKSWLTRPDPRAYRVDPFRQSRSLHALLEEFPCSGALISNEAGISALNDYFSSPLFHQCIQQRGSLADAFGNYLQTQPFHDPRIKPMARLEQSIVQLRRQSLSPLSPLAPNHLMLAPNKTVVALPKSTVELRSVVWTRLMEEDPNPVTAMINGTPHLEALPSLDETEQEFLLLEISADENIHIEALSDALFELLHTTAQAVTMESLLHKIGEIGMSATEAQQVIEEVIEDGLLNRG
jgi:hypothetical protein